ncbi:MAG: UvrD-helicase domain-containing protein, partial [Prevotella bivia]|nr:UvrD-helicase domain-containing protein [Prevotella bivia]
MANNDKALTVYRASAGSGKTFTLTVEYISILVKNPEDYNKMLAVTFTNKATQEMKLRILSQLYGIGNGLPSSDNYLLQVKAKTGMTETSIRNNALYILEKLTHEYQNFRVQTIDAFFQTVLRNLGKELGLTANLRVDLNTQQVEAKAVDQLIDSLRENDPMLKWIDEYISSNIEEDRSWNVVKEIKEFGKTIFDELYKTHEKQLDKIFKDEKFVTDFIKRLRFVCIDYEKSIKEKAKNIVEKIATSAIPINYFASYAYNQVVKLSKGKIENGDPHIHTQRIIKGEKQWASSKCSKKADKEMLNSFVEGVGLTEMVANLEASRIEGWKMYCTSKLVLLHLSKLRLLHKIAKQVEDDNLENHRFMLSNTQSLLKNLMKDNDIPFVFERIGAMLKYIMIDEFQDTSRV